MGSQSGERRPRGRPRGYDPEAVEDALVEVFWRRGFEGASMAELSVATGASRASLYKMGDKGALMALALDRYAARFEARVEATLAKGLPMREAVAETLGASADRLCDPAAPPGCLRCRAMLERPADPRIVEAAARADAAFLAGMERLVGPRGAFLTAVVNGMVVLAESGASRATLQSVIDAALEAL